MKMKQINLDIHKSIHDAGIYYYQVAEKYGLNDGNFSRLLRKKLTIDQKEKILEIIEDLKRI
jgi:predicted XRE-type DNA-binding protein